MTPFISSTKKYVFFLLEAGSALLRVTDMETNNRMLIRELKKDIKDLAFAYTRPAVILGAVDDIGTTHVFNIQRTENDI